MRVVVGDAEGKGNAMMIFLGMLSVEPGIKRKVSLRDESREQEMKVAHQP